MAQAGFREGNDRVAWWKVAMHLDEAQLALTNAIAYNVDDPTAALAVQERLREAQAILLDIFSARGLLPAAGNGAVDVPPASSAPSVSVDVDGGGPAMQVIEAEAVLTDEAASAPAAEINDVPTDDATAAVKAEAYEAATSAEAEVSR